MFLIKNDKYEFKGIMKGLEAEVLELKANQKTEAKGIVIESRLDKGLGAVAIEKPS